MKIIFCLAWVTRHKPAQKDFGSGPAFSMVADYARRIGRFAPCEFAGYGALSEKPLGRRLWLCHTSEGSKLLSSDKLAKSVQGLQNASVRELCIAVGGPDGFAANDISRWQPDNLWSFGPMTLPHELAAVIAAEQVYRAYTILNRLPYHTEH